MGCAHLPDFRASGTLVESLHIVDLHAYNFKNTPEKTEVWVEIISRNVSVGIRRGKVFSGQKPKNTYNPSGYQGTKAPRTYMLSTP